MRKLLRRFSSYVAMSSYEVKHNVKGREFYIALEKGKAVLQYENEGNNTMNMYHTGVPTEYRGQGIAGHLAKAALDYAVVQDAKVKLTCTYLQKYVKDNPSPEYTSRVV
ncbi:protein NATD1-like [Orbicella faveolata]|uniref:protein NATD1-like n=1 Tax=Orbicella faveolata TaxID=48498 RepID=UPI0009E441E8|nr:protein NATD1-like [Orbicella faveolata]